MICWHKYPKKWKDSDAVYVKSNIPASQYKRCERCHKVKWRST